MTKVDMIQRIDAELEKIDEMLAGIYSGFLIIKYGWHIRMLEWLHDKIEGDYSDENSITTEDFEYTLSNIQKSAEWISFDDGDYEFVRDVFFSDIQSLTEKVEI